jgi:hypothetical protein
MTRLAACFSYTLVGTQPSRFFGQLISLIWATQALPFFPKDTLSDFYLGILYP